jgi:hypothetical protein
MPSIINSDNGSVSGAAGLKFTSGDDGVLKLQNNGTDAMSVSAAGVVTFSDQPVLPVPLFYATAGSQVVAANGTPTKMSSFGTPDIDNKSWWDAGNQRYIPQIEGWYGVNVIFTAVSTTASIPLSLVAIYKNGFSVKSFAERSANINSLQAYGSWFVYLNGTTDYLELWGRNYTATDPTGTGEMQIYLISRASA